MPIDEINKIKLLKSNKFVKKKIKEDKKIVIMSKNLNNMNKKNKNNYNNIIHCNNNTIKQIINNKNTLNNNTINNNNFNIKINPFGEENTDFLTKKEKLKIINKCYMSIPALIKTIHDRPENRNIYIPNMNKNILAYLNKKNELEYNDYDKVCDKLIQKNIDRLDQYFYEFEKELKESIKTRMIKVIEENNNGNLDEKYMNDIKYYLMTISKKNKKELHECIDKIELELQTI